MKNKILFLFIFFSLFFIDDVFAINDSRLINEIEKEINIDIGKMEEEGYYIDNIDDIIEFIELSNNVQDSSSTIIPNHNIVESVDGNIAKVSTDVYVNVQRLTEQGNSIKLVIGEATAVTEEEYNELCRIVQSEAGNQDLIGKILVANVVLNRVKSSRFEQNTIHDVIFAPGQFSPVSNGSFFTCKVSEDTEKAVKQVLNGVDYSDGALYFMARAYSYRKNVTWFDTSLQYLFRHGGHEFFK